MEVITMHSKRATAAKPGTRLILLFMLCFGSSMFGGAVSTLMSVYLPVVVSDLKGGGGHAGLNEIGAFINSVFIFGWAAGGFLWGLISDKIGRKVSLILAMASYGIFTVCTGLISGWWGIVTCRFMSGFGVGGDLVIAFTLLSEVWPERSKAIYTGILSIGFPVGIFSAGLVNYFVTSWRQGFFIGVIPVALAVAGWWIIRESDVWIEHKRSFYTADKPREGLFSVANKRALLTGSVVFGTMLIGLWAIFSWLPTWIQSLLATDAHRERGLSMMFMGMGGLIGGFLSGWLVNMAGLRRSLLTCFAVCTLLALLLFGTNHHFSVAIYIEIAILALFFGASQGILSVYIPMLFPTVIRASATGFCFNIGRIFTGTAVLLVGVLVTALGGYGNSLFIFSMVFVVGLAVVVFIRNINPAAENLK